MKENKIRTARNIDATDMFDLLSILTDVEILQMKTENIIRHIIGHYTNMETRRGKDMNAVAKRITETPAGNWQEMAVRIKNEAPTLAELSSEQLEQIARIAMTQRLTDDFKKKIDIAGIDFKAEKELFLSTAGKTQSVHTRIAYRTGLERLETWAAVKGIAVLELTAAQADDFIYSLRNEKNNKTGNDKSPATVRLNTAAVSSFFTWIHRRHNVIENHFRGTNALPGKKASRTLAVPSADEVRYIIDSLPSDMAAAVSLMAYRSLRAGALPTLSISGERCTYRSKGKDYAGKLPPKTLRAVKAAGLPLRSPFAGILANTLEKRIARVIAKLHKEGKLEAPYSAHDFRHFFRLPNIIGIKTYTACQNYSAMRQFKLPSII
jgi:hypothetical protein